MRIAIAAWLTFTLPAVSHTQELNYNSAQIRHDLERLRTAATVLYVAAHPDDENTRLISYLVNERHFRTAYLSLTRGEGGQNLIGSEHGPALGVIRTHELHAARRTDGGEQYFTSAADFGYSKSAEETLKKWDRETILRQMVLVIRKLKPDVIICRFPTTGEGGHGHHTASAILALEAFDAAADRTKFPEQLNDHDTWQCRRIYWNTYNFSSANTIGPGQFTLDVGGYNPVLGKSYGEIASASRSMHKSQGFGTVAQRGALRENFKLLKGDSTGSDIFAGMPTGLSRFGSLKKAVALVDKCIDNYDPAAPGKSISQLIAFRKSLMSIKSNETIVRHWIDLKLRESQKLLTRCAGLWLDAACTTPSAIPGSDVTLRLSALNRSNANVQLLSVRLNGTTFGNTAKLEADQTFTMTATVRIPDTTATSDPFWQSGGANAAVQFIRSDYSGRQVTPPALHAEFLLSINGETITARREVTYRRGDPVKGEISHPLFILPALEIRFDESVYVTKPGEKKNARVWVTGNGDSARCVVRFHCPAGYQAEPFDSICTVRSGETKAIDITFRSNGAETGTIGVTALPLLNSTTGKKYNTHVRWIAHHHIPTQVMQEEARAYIVSTDLKHKNQRIGYIPGAGDEVARCLQQAGYRVTILESEKISDQALSQFDAVVTGIRAFNTDENLHRKMPALLQYVNNGGNLIVQYNTNSRVGPLAFTPGPFPYSITRQRVTDENAPVQFLEREHPALNSPNQITEKDFGGWVQERGIYFAESKDNRYKKILSMNDPGEKPLDGSLIVAQHGKGNFVYTGLAFFRQLPAGVPGAYKLFANLLALPGH